MNRIDEIEAAQANLPGFLRRDRETIEMDEHAQDLRRATFSRARLTEEERTVSYGVTLEQIARANLELPDVDIETESARLAQGLELQGRLTEASEVSPRQEEKDRLLAVEAAVNADDEVFCECPAVTTKVNGESVEIHPHYEVKKIYSRKHKGMVSLVCCTVCSGMNASPNPPEQLQRVIHAQRAAGIAGKPTEHEHAVLRTNGKIIREQR